jgi:hypothetical protein
MKMRTKKKRAKNTIVAVFALLISGSVVYAQKVSVDADPAAPLSTYRPYAWANGTPAPNPLNEDRIHAGVDARLAAKGLAMNTTAPDLIVATHVTTKERQELIAQGYGYGPWWGTGYTSTHVETYIDGT